MENAVAILILAAGLSQRLGSPKQLLEYQGQSLLQNSVTKALGVCQDVYVLLGNAFEECKTHAQGARILYHQDYHKGIGSSIKKGVRDLSHFGFILITLCDYPLLPQEHLLKLIESKDPQKITATSCGGIHSSPAIFPKKYYPLLLELKDDEGAKKLLEKYPKISVEIHKKYLFDIDTKEDWENLIHHSSSS